MPEFITIPQLSTMALFLFVFSFAWFVSFHKDYVRLTGTTDDVLKKNRARNAAILLFCSLLATLFIAWIVNLAGATTFWGGALIGFYCWLGFLFTNYAADYAFADKSLKLYFINSTWQLITYPVVGGILGIWV